MTEWDIDEDGNLRPVLVEYDFDPTYDDGKGPYVVEKWAYYGFEVVKRFYQSEDAQEYALRKARKHKARYRVLGPVKEETEEE